VAVTVVLPGRAQVFGDLIEAAYGLHRSALARQLRWPLPANPSQEHHQGQPLWCASEIPDTGSNRVRPGMEDGECQNGAGSLRMSSKMRP
jgi:hypothetical protein